MRKRFIKLITNTDIMLVFVISAISCKKNITQTQNTAVTTPITKPVSPVTPVTPVTYTQIWSDEFNGSKIDISVWNMETGVGVNNEKEYYQAANSDIENGNQVITAKSEFVGGVPYTSARMNTLNKFSAKFGRIEARIKIPLGDGLWPAFWMMGSDIQSLSWPICGEIDIIEHVNADNLLYGTIHWNGGKYVDKTTVTTPDDYHLYAVKWDENEIRWYVDQMLFVTANIEANVNNIGAFHLPFFIILNLAVAGDFPGQTVDQGKLPAKRYVDYVRV